ncbi:MAG: methyltransferase domain-containing protein [Bacteroidota bacterium]
MKLADHTTHYKRDAEQFDYFAERSGADNDAARRLQETVMHELPKYSKQLLLDLGSGGGWVIEALNLPNEATPRVVCADLGIASLRKIRQRFPTAMLVAADAERLPFRQRSFGAVLASEVLEHLNDPALVVRQVSDVLTPSGKFVVSTPYRERLRYYLCVHCNQPTPVNAHLHSFDEHSLTTVFSETGFRNIRTATFQNKAMLFLRVSWVLRFLPWTLWRLIDRFCNFVVRKPHSIVITGDNPEIYD